MSQEEERARQVFADVNRFFAEDVAAFRAKIQASGIGLLPEWKPIELGAAREEAPATP